MMKIASIQRRSKGFALVATLSLMVLLVIIAVGLLSLATISLRSSSHESKMAEARANAHLGLMLAIGKLQKSAGPDQRITASADLAGFSNNSMWTGVWSTTTTGPEPKPMVSGHSNGGYLTDLRNSDPNLANGKWKGALRLGWLVSGDEVEPDSVKYPDPNSIQLVGNASLGGATTVGDKRLVSAPYVKTLNAGKTTGGYAFWVGDESQKARIDLGTPYNQVQPDPNTPDDGGLYRLAGAAGPDFNEVKSDGGTPYQGIRDLTDRERSKFVSLNTVSLKTSGTGSPSSNFHDITTSSRGLLTNVVMGGLQKDLAAVIERTSTIPPIPGVAESGMPLDRKILTPANYANTGPSFAQLRNWYKLKDQIQGGMLDARLDTPVFAKTRAGLPASYFKLTAPLPDITSKAQSVQPYLTDCRLAFDMSLDTSRANGRAVRLHLYPRVTLWNPYNVTLKGQRYFVGCAVPRVNNFAVALPNGSFNDTGKSEPIPGTDGLWYPNISENSSSEGGSKGAMVYFELAAVDIGPGESLVFSPDLSTSAGTKLAGKSAQYSSSFASANVLSPDVAAGTNNFYIESNRMVPNVVNLSTKPDYTFRGGVNQAWAGAPTMFLKRMTASGSGNVSPAMLEGSGAETLHLHHYGQNGNKHGWWWYLFDNAKKPVNGGEGFQNYLLNPDRYPPRLWALQTRMRWLDETDEEQAIGNTHAGAGGPLFYNNSIIGNFNVRASIVQRDPFSYWNGWNEYAPGGFMIPWSTPRLNDPRMDSPFRNGKAYGSPVSTPAQLSASPAFAMFDVPRKGSPLFSLASFQHAQLGLHSWQPTYVIGNSIAEPRADRDRTVNMKFFDLKGDAWGDKLAVANQRPGDWNGLLQGHGAETLIHDMSYQVNQQLWDRYFLSSMPYSAESVSWDPETPLPNSRLRLLKGRLAEDAKPLLLGNNSFDTAAYFLANEGAFNVNSTSVEAWRAMFSSLNDINRPTANGDTITATFSRLMFPMSEASPDSTWSGGTWNGARALSAADIDTLARSMVTIVRSRGPFLGLADFVNRRLAAAATNGVDDPSLCGPLQAAIELSQINGPLQQSRDLTSRDAGGANKGADGDIAPDWNAFYPYKNFGAPGYITQADVLQTLGQSLTTRGDTFVIRSYGDATDASGKVVARAWCEAVVQRTPEYVASGAIDQPSSANGNNPIEPALLGAGSPNGTDFKSSRNTALVPVNREFGRKFVIQSFRWLAPSEI